jgi:UDPglucose--hexose-1-phosphate uridylyltransferase
VELRFNELRGEEVVYAAHRQDRAFLPAREDCPLCGRPALEVFPNDFPALAPPGGACEVIVYGEDHDGSFASLPAELARGVVEVWRERYAELGARPEVQYVMPFENRGEQVGVTLHHPHGQVYAFPFVPPVPAAERAADARLGRCAPCAAVAAETGDGRRLVHDAGAFVAYVPYAARWPYEVHVTAREHRASLLDCPEEELAALAAALQAVTRGYDALFGFPLPYILCVHQAPTDGGGDGHLHVELYSPVRARGKLKQPAGCEQGAGTLVMDVLREESAAELRGAVARAA